MTILSPGPVPKGTPNLADVGGIHRVAVATDRSETADQAVTWASAFAMNIGAELLILQVLPPGPPGTTEAGAAAGTRARTAASDLARVAAELAGVRGRAKVLVDQDPAGAIVRAAEEARADVLVVGNAGMQGRTKFLLDNVPNRISHSARCTVIIVNTNTTPPSATKVDRVETEMEPEPPLLLGRAAQIGRVMAKHGLRELFGSKGGDPRARAQALRSALEELGPTFSKLGQILSTRPDLLPPVFTEELASLQDHVPPLTERQVVEVMEQELRVPWEDVFSGIDPEPMAAGTIAQVHGATLTDGTRAVVKIQRPGAREDIERDLGLLEMFARKAGSRPGLKQVVDLEAIAEHLSSSLQRELDFRTEAANIERMRIILEPYSRLAVPDVYTDYTTQRLLVLRFIDGTSIRSAPEGPERKEAARQLLESYYRQVLNEGFFHADPHPGNLLWCDGMIYFIDFGMVGEIGPDLRRNLMMLLLAFWQEDAAFLTDITLMVAGQDQRQDIDLAKFESEMGELVTRYRNLSLRDIQLGPILQEMTEIAIRHDVPLPASLTLTTKALAQVQLAVAELDPDLDPFAVAGSYLGRNLLNNFRERLDPRTLFYMSQKLSVRVVRSIEALERLTGARPGPKLQVHFRGTENLEADVRRAGRRLSLAFLSAGALIGTGMLANASVGSWAPVTAGAAAGVFSGALVIDLLRRR
ncbi:MAG: AarF/UbiB family protein [Actinomycetota bacterium]